MSSNLSQITTLALIAASLLVPLANAFRFSATATPPILPPFDLSVESNKQSRTSEVAKLTSTDAFSNKLSISRRNFKYDLGLGKNKPVTNNKTAEETPSINNDQEPTQFLIDHESVRQYPSPLNFDSESQNRKINRSKNERKILPKVRHRRHSEDVLHIRDIPTIASSVDDSNGGDYCHPIIVPVKQNYAGINGSIEKLDINTIWVEMMLHDEQKKFSMST